jgi:hypothetical protein
MKKNLYLFISLTLVIASCYNDNSSSDNSIPDNSIPDSKTPAIILLKKTIKAYLNKSVITTNYTYDGNKLVSITNNSGKVNSYFTYTGDVITTIEYKFPDGRMFYRNTYEYDSKNRLIRCIKVDLMNSDVYMDTKDVYHYNEDNTILVISSSGNSQAELSTDGSAVMTFSNGEISEITSTDGWNKTYTYDAKNNPLKNVLGIDKISFTMGKVLGNLHNVVSGTIGDEVTLVSVITYNSDNFPVKTEDTSYGEVSSTELFY